MYASAQNGAGGTNHGLMMMMMMEATPFLLMLAAYSHCWMLLSICRA